MTDEQYRQKVDQRRTAAQASIDAGGAAPGMDERSTPTRPVSGAMMSAMRATSVERSRQNQQAAADAGYLATAGRQDAKAPGTPAAGRAGQTSGGAGYSTLLTGGTASNALTAKKPRSGVPSLLGG